MSLVVANIEELAPWLPWRMQKMRAAQLKRSSHTSFNSRTTFSKAGLSLCRRDQLLGEPTRRWKSPSCKWSLTKTTNLSLSSAKTCKTNQVWIKMPQLTLEVSPKCCSTAASLAQRGTAATPAATTILMPQAHKVPSYVAARTVKMILSNRRRLPLPAVSKP